MWVVTGTKATRRLWRPFPSQRDKLSGHLVVLPALSGIYRQKDGKICHFRIGTPVAFNGLGNQPLVLQASG